MDELDQIFAQLAAKQQGRPQSMAEIFNDALSQVDQQTPPAQQPVPPVANPFGQMASTFASTLAEQLGARGASAGNFARLEEQKKRAAEVEQTNYAKTEAFNHDRQMQRMGILMKIGDAKAKLLEDQGDMDKYEAQVKVNMTLADKARKAQEEFDLKKLGIEHKNRMAEIAAKPGTSKADEAQNKEDKEILKFQEDISNVSKKPGNTAKTPAHTAGVLQWIGMDKSTPETINLTGPGVDAILSRSKAAVQSVNGDRLRRAALETFFETAKNSGRLTAGSKEYRDLVILLKTVFKTPEERSAWVSDHPIQ